MEVLKEVVLLKYEYSIGLHDETINTGGEVYLLRPNPWDHCSAWFARFHPFQFVITIVISHYTI